MLPVHEPTHLLTDFPVWIPFYSVKDVSGNMNNSVVEGSGLLLYSRLLRGMAGDIFMV